MVGERCISAFEKSQKPRAAEIQVCIVDKKIEDRLEYFSNTAFVPVDNLLLCTSIISVSTGGRCYTRRGLVLDVAKQRHEACALVFVLVDSRSVIRAEPDTTFPSRGGG